MVGEAAEAVAAETVFTISDDFLFGVDLTLPVPSMSSPDPHS
jgi:hypothetical protein